MTDKTEPKKDGDFTFLLRSPGIHEASHIVTAVVEETLMDLILNGEDPSAWENESWRWDNLNERLFDEDGEIILSAQGPELWEFMKDPHCGFQNYSEQVRIHLAQFRDHNESYIHTLHDNYDIRHLRVIRAFRNQWLMLAEGVKK